MDSLFAILVLIVLALLIGSVLGWVAFGRTNTLRYELAVLRRRLDALEAGGAVPRPAKTFDDRAAAGPEPEPEPEVPAAPRPEAPAAEAPAAEEAAPAPAEPPAADAPAPEPAVPIPVAARKRDLEEAIGTRWAVWVGGLALALGGVFLVRYSIESGLLGPGARILLGLLFAAALIGAGEWLRRTGHGETDAATARKAYVPGVLVAAGIVAGFAAVYAAYALYGFLNDLAAFVALGLIAFGALALALLHGPAIAGLGLVASYATPLLVSSQEPSLAALTLYLFAVTAATFAVARLKAWRWLAITAAVGSVLWSLLMTATSGWFGGDAPILAVHILGSFALAFAVFVVTIHPRDPDRLAPHDKVAVAVLAAFVLPAVFHLAWNGTTDSGTILLALVGGAFALGAWFWPAVRLLAGAVVATVLLGYANFNVAYVGLMHESATGEMVPPGFGELLANPVTGRMILTGVVYAILFAALGLVGSIRSAARTGLALVGSAIPLGILAITYLRTGDFTVSLAYGALALALAAFFAGSAEALIRRLAPQAPGTDGAIAVYAVAAVTALGAAFAVTLEKGMLTIALALMVPAIAWVETARPVRGLRFAATAVALVVAARFAWDPAVVGSDLGTTPIFNWILYGYGVPSAAFGFAAWRFGRTRMDRWVPIFEALAVVFTTLTVVLLIHHAMNGGRLTATVSGVAEHALVVTALLAVSLGMQWLGIRRPSPVFGQGTLVMGALGLLFAAGGLVVVYNPLFTGEAIDGGALDADLLLGYLLPAIVAFAVAALARRRTDVAAGWYARAAAWLGGLLGAIWVTLAVRAAWHSGDLAVGSIEETELYAYSAVWLACGLAILGFGVVTGSRAVRMVSAAVVMLVVAKVFLLDTSGLTGALRALSFIGLGLVLVGVGLAYQKILRRPAVSGSPPPAGP